MCASIKNTKSVILPAYNKNLIRAILGITTGERKLPELTDEQVLIKMEAAPCNPSDIAFIRGVYNVIKPLPAVPGFEGAGVVVDTGSKTTELFGKRVSSFIQAEMDGTWAEFFVAEKKNCIVLKEELDIEQGACLAINPFTAYGLIEMAVSSNCNAVIQNAAGGQVAEFIRSLAKLNGIAVIDIVRKPEHVTKLTNKGAEYVLDSSSENFNTDLSDLINTLQSTIAFDAVGGEMTGLFLNHLPPFSRVVLYGGLAGGSLGGIDPMDIIFNGKILEGFNLNEWISNKSNEEFERINHKIQDLIITGKIKTQIQASFILDDVVNGMRSYIKSMSDGKVLFKP